MAFITLPSAAITAGEPVTQDLWSKTKDNFDDHESRIGTVETVNNLYHPIEFNVVGTYTSNLIGDGKIFERIFFAKTILGVKLVIWTAGSSGSTTIDVEKKTGAGAWTSILTAPITASSASGSLFVASGTLAITSLSPADLLRLNVDAVQGGTPDSFSVFIEFEGA